MEPCMLKVWQIVLLFLLGNKQGQPFTKKDLGTMGHTQGIGSSVAKPAKRM